MISDFFRLKTQYEFSVLDRAIHEFRRDREKSVALHSSIMHLSSQFDERSNYHLCKIHVGIVNNECNVHKNKRLFNNWINYYIANV